MRTLRTALPLILAGALAACAQPSTRVADPGCYNATRTALVARGLDPATITSMTYHATRAIYSRAIQDRNVWVRTSVCRGYMVARVGADCQIIELYATGDCAVPERRS